MRVTINDRSGAGLPVTMTEKPIEIALSRVDRRRVLAGVAGAGVGFSQIAGVAGHVALTALHQLPATW